MFVGHGIRTDTKAVDQLRENVQIEVGYFCYGWGTQFYLGVCRQMRVGGVSFMKLRIGVTRSLLCQVSPNHSSYTGLLGLGFLAILGGLGLD